MHLARRWFTGLSFDQEIPQHFTFSKNRHGCFQASNLFQQLFGQIVDPCMEAGLVEGEHLSVDGSFTQANVSRSTKRGAFRRRHAGRTYGKSLTISRLRTSPRSPRKLSNASPVLCHRERKSEDVRQTSGASFATRSASRRLFTERVVLIRKAHRGVAPLERRGNLKLPIHEAA